MEKEALKNLLTQNFYLIYLLEILALALVIWNMNKKKVLLTLAGVTILVGIFSLCAMKYNWFPASLLIWQLNAVLFSTAVSVVPSQWKFWQRILLWLIAMILLVGVTGVIELFLIWIWLPLFLLIRFFRVHSSNTNGRFQSLFAAVSMLVLYFIFMFIIFLIFAGFDFYRAWLWAHTPVWLKSLEGVLFLVGRIGAIPDSVIFSGKFATLLWNLAASASGSHYAIKAAKGFLKKYDPKITFNLFSIGLILVYATLVGFVMVPVISTAGFGVYSFIDLARPILTPAVAIGVAYFHKSASE